MTPDSKPLDAKMGVRIEIVTLHVDEEEPAWFPQVSGASRAPLRDTGAGIAQKRKTAPERPARSEALAKVVGAVIA